MSIATIPSKYAHFYLVYCLGCKEPMYGVNRPCPQRNGHTRICGSCGAVNIFRDSTQPVELKPSDDQAITRAICTRDNTPQNLGPQSPSPRSEMNRSPSIRPPSADRSGSLGS